MDVRYSQFDPRIMADLSMEKVMKLFMQLVSQSGGDVQQALDWLDRLWERYNFFDGEYGIEDFKKYLERSGNVAEARTGQMKLTEKGERRIRQDAFEEIFSHLRSDTLGNHASSKAGFGGERLPETRDFEFGDPTGDIDFTRSIHNSVVRTGQAEIDLAEDDLEVYEREHLTSSATVIAIDISHSMTLYGEDRITPAKKVAMALIELITTRYPKDSLDVVLFGDDAFLVPHKQVPFITNGPYHTNTKAGIDLSARLLLRKRQVNKQIVMVTDGKPTAIQEAGRIYKNPSWYLDPKIVSQTINSAVYCRRKGIIITTFMITSDPYLKDFVDRMTKANKGRAFFASLDNLGSFILTDYVRNRSRRVG
jgi:Ca-activated chloride channel homolog